MTRVEHIGDAVLYQGDALAVMAEMPENSVDTVITDPPYELNFMGKGWDNAGVSFDKATWAAVMRVAKPGAMLLCFGGTRTFHRIACAIEDAGWELRDTMMWVYGSGFPKSLDISKAIDKAAGAEREVVGRKTGRSASPVSDMRGGHMHAGGTIAGTFDASAITAPVTDAARLWHGYGTALKPAWEPIIIAMKPLDGTFVQNALKHGVAGLNIDGGRVEANDGVPKFTHRKEPSINCFGDGKNGSNRTGDIDTQTGRFPANVIHDGSEEVLEAFPQTASGQPCGTKAGGQGNAYGEFAGGIPVTGFGDSGSAARFFYCAKASRFERDAGCEGLAGRTGAQAVDRKENTAGLKSPRAGAGRSAENVKNFHPTVKPVALMRYLARLTKTPTGGVVLDPFAGSGTTLLACLTEGRSCIGIEKHPDYFDIALKRIDREVRQGNLFTPLAKPKQEKLI